MKKIAMVFLFTLAMITVALANEVNNGKPNSGGNMSSIFDDDEVAIFKRLDAIRPMIDDPIKYINLVTLHPDGGYETNDEYALLVHEWNNLIAKVGRNENPYELRGPRVEYLGKQYDDNIDTNMMKDPNAIILAKDENNNYIIKYRGMHEFQHAVTMEDIEANLQSGSNSSLNSKILNEEKDKYIEPNNKPLSLKEEGKAAPLFFDQSFENGTLGNFTATDSNSTTGLDYWGAHKHQTYNYWYAWCAQNASNVNTRDSGYYNDNMDAVMMDGVGIDCKDRDSLYYGYQRWVKAEPNYDFFYAYMSFDKVNWLYVERVDTAASWTNIYLSTSLSVDRIYWKFKFHSDNSYHNYYGACVDEIAAGGYLPNLIYSNPSGSSDPIVISSTTGTSTSSVVYARVPAYYDWAVKNIGIGAVKRSFNTRIKIDGTSVGNLQTNSLTANSVNQVTDFSFTCLSWGTRTVSVSSDDGNNITETSENDNAWSKQVYFKPLPNLQSNSIYTSSNITVGQTCTIYWGINNIYGDTVAYSGSGIVVRLYIDGVVIDEKTVNNVSVGGNMPFSTTYTASIGGNHTISVQCDAVNAVFEYNENDNAATLVAYWNRPPNQCALIAPGNNSTGVILDPVMQWSCIDPDGDAITQYQLQLDDDSDFSSPIYSDDNLTATWWRPDDHGIHLLRNTLYFWRVRGFDGKVWGPTGTTWNFITANDKFWVSGTIQYFNEDTMQIKPLPRVRVQLFDYNISNNTPLVIDSTDATGFVNFWWVTASPHPQFHIEVSLQNAICIVKDGTPEPPSIFADTITVDDTLNINTTGIINFTINNTDFHTALYNNACHISDGIYRTYKWINANSNNWLISNRPQLTVYYQYNDTLSTRFQPIPAGVGRIFITGRKQVLSSSGDTFTCYRLHGPYHEYSHAVMYKMYNDAPPWGHYLGNHTPYTITDPSFALSEGFAEFVPCAVTADSNHFCYYKSLSNTAIKNIETNSWHINSVGADADSIEGAIASIFYDLQDGHTDGDESGGAVSGFFPTIFKVLKDKKPAGMRAFYDSLKTYYVSEPTLAGQDKQIRGIYKSHGIELPPAFVADFEPGHAPPYINNILYTYGMSGVSTAVVGEDNGVKAAQGSQMYRISGQDVNSVSSSYAYCRLYDLFNLPQVNTNSHLVFWLYVKQSPNNFGHIYLDAETDGSAPVSLRNCAAYDQNGIWVHASAHTVPNGQWMQYIVNLTSLNTRTLNRILLDYDDGNNSEVGAFTAYVDDIRLYDSIPFNNEWYAECLSGHKNSLVSFDTSDMNGGAELFYNVSGPYDTVWVNGPSIRKNIPDIAMSPDSDYTINWSQYDRAHALQFMLLVQGADTVDRWLIYCANGSNHWSEFGANYAYVNMTGPADQYNSFVSYSSSVCLDYMKEFGKKAKIIKEMKISHFAYSGWPAGNYGGIVRDVAFIVHPVIKPVTYNLTGYAVYHSANNVYNARLNWRGTVKTYPIDCYSAWVGYSNGLNTVYACINADIHGTSYEVPGAQWALPAQGYWYHVAAQDAIGNIGASTGDILIKPPVNGDPIVAASSDVMATAFSNGKKLALDGSGKLHVTYTSGDTVFYTCSTDDGNNWISPKYVGLGKNPAIQLKTADSSKSNPHGSNSTIPSICYVDVNSLYYAEQSGSAWSSPSCIYQGQPDEEISYLSYVVNQANRQSYVGWVSTTPGGSQVSVSPYSPGSSQSQLSPTPIDQGGQTTLFKSPSMVIGKAGNLITSWSNNGVVRYNDGNGVIELSEPGLNCIHPIVSTYGDRTSVAWMEQIAPASKNEAGKYQIVSRDKTVDGWSDPIYISYPDSGDAQFPVVAANGQFVFTKEYGDGNYDINYVGNYANGWESYVQNISLNSGGQSNYPDVLFRTSWPQHKLYILWSEVNTSKIILPPVHVKMYVKQIEPVPSYAVYPITESASPYTTQRAGAICYGMGRYQTVDYDPNKLSYHFSDLNPSLRYQVKAVYYRNTTGTSKGGQSDDWHEMLKAGNTILANTHVPETTVVKEIQLIPKNRYRDGQVDITIERKKGDYALCASLEVIEYEGDGNNPKDASETSQEPMAALVYHYELRQNAPNPTAGHTQFHYQLAGAGQTSLNIYNTLGQLVRKVIDQVQQPGIYTTSWDGKDERGKEVASGVYMYRISSGTFCDTKKLVMLR